MLSIGPMDPRVRGLNGFESWLDQRGSWVNAIACYTCMVILSRITRGGWFGHIYSRTVSRASCHMLIKDSRLHYIADAFEIYKYCPEHEIT